MGPPTSTPRWCVRGGGCPCVRAPLCSSCLHGARSPCPLLQPVLPSLRGTQRSQRTLLNESARLRASASYPPTPPPPPIYWLSVHSAPVLRWLVSTVAAERPLYLGLPCGAEPNVAKGWKLALLPPYCFYLETEEREKGTPPDWLVSSRAAPRAAEPGNVVIVFSGRVVLGGKGGGAKNKEAALVIAFC